MPCLISLGNVACPILLQLITLTDKGAWVLPLPNHRHQHLNAFSYSGSKFERSDYPGSDLFSRNIILWNGRDARKIKLRMSERVCFTGVLRCLGMIQIFMPITSGWLVALSWQIEYPCQACSVWYSSASAMLLVYWSSRI